MLIFFGNDPGHIHTAWRGSCRASVTYSYIIDGRPTNPGNKNLIVGASSRRYEQSCILLSEPSNEFMYLQWLNIVCCDMEYF